MATAIAKQKKQKKQQQATATLKCKGTQHKKAEINVRQWLQQCF